jgi:hypothetical protein
MRTYHLSRERTYVLTTLRYRYLTDFQTSSTETSVYAM